MTNDELEEECWLDALTIEPQWFWWRATAQLSVGVTIVNTTRRSLRRRRAIIKCLATAIALDEKLTAAKDAE